MAKPHLRPSAAELYEGPKTLAISSNHAAASHDDPAMIGWYPSSQSADADLLDELRLIRDRNIDLERNNGYVAGANQVFKDNIVGHQLRVNPAPSHALLGLSPEEAEAWGRDVRSKFETWFNQPSEVDAARDLTGRGLTIQALGSWFLTGEALALPIWRPREGCLWNTRIQVVDASRLENPPLGMTRTSNVIRGGKELDRHGATVAYWIRRTTPGDERFARPDALAADLWSSYSRIPAFYPWGRRRVIHLYDKERPGQSRGKTIVASIMREFRMATQYPRVELQATIANSLVAGVLESNLDSETAAQLFTSGQDRNAYWESAIAKYRNATTLKPGATLALPLGAKFVGFTPNRPNNQFDKFMESVLHNLAAGLSLPYELLAHDFSKTNYSSARAAMLEAWRHFMNRRAWIEEGWLNPLYELWLEEAVNAGQVEAPGFYENRFAYSNTRKWSMTGRGWVDPAKEAEGAKTRMGSRITSLAHECSEQGQDWMDVIDQIKIIEDYAKERGVSLTAEPSSSGANGARFQSSGGSSENVGDPEDSDDRESEEPETEKTSEE